MDTIITCLKQLAQSRYGADVEPILSRPDEQFGDFSTNVAMQLAARTGKNPREIASELAAALKEELGGEVTDVSVAGPGFINVTVSDLSLF
jgi:arginyl-tRNA synthetase